MPTRARLTATVAKAVKPALALTLIAAAFVAFASASSATADLDPPAAVVYDIEFGNCTGLWLDADGNPTLVEGEGMGVVALRADVWTLNCRFVTDFDSGDVATLDDVCSVFADLCNGNGALVAPRFTTCFLDDMVTQNQRSVVTPSGQRHLICHFNPAG